MKKRIAEDTLESFPIFLKRNFTVIARRKIKYFTLNSRERSRNRDSRLHLTLAQLRLHPLMILTLARLGITPGHRDQEKEKDTFFF